MVDSINNNPDQTYYAFVDTDSQAAQKTKKEKKEKTGSTEKPNDLPKETSKETFDSFEAMINDLETLLGLDNPTDVDLKKITEILKKLETMRNDPKNPNAALTDPMYDLADNFLKSLAAKGFTSSGYIPEDGKTSALDSFKAWQTELAPKIEDINSTLAFTKLYSLNGLEALYALIAFTGLDASMKIFENLSKDFANVEQLLALIKNAINNIFNKSKVNPQDDLHNPPESMADFPFDDPESFDAIYKAFENADIEVETIKGEDGVEYIVLANGDKFPVYKYENGQIVKDEKGNPVVRDDPDLEQILESIYKQEQAAILAELDRRKDEVPPPTLRDVAKNYTKTAEFIKQYVFNDEEDPSESVTAMRTALEEMYKAYAEQITAPQLEVNAASGEEFKKLIESLMGDPNDPDKQGILAQLKGMDPVPEDIINPSDKVLTMLKQALTDIGKNPDDLKSLTAEDYMLAASKLVNNDPTAKFTEYLQQAGGATENKVNNLSAEVKDQNQKVQNTTQYATTGAEAINKMYKTMIQGWR